MFEEANKVIDESRQGLPTVLESSAEGKRKLYLESYGCAMNMSDSEIVASIMGAHGFSTTAQS
jgi:tRNA-2-methylthio-N6-dimethylallyladenosine synthase